MDQPKTQQAQPLRVLMVTPRFFPDMGGIETHVYEVARRLAKSGVDVTVLATDRSGTRPAQEDVEGIHVRRVPAYPKNQDFYFAPAIGKIIQEGDWPIIHCQGFHTFVPPIAMRAARRKGTPYVLTFHSGGHSNDWRNSIRDVQTKMLGGLLRGADRLIGVSRFEAELFARRLNIPIDRITVILNGSNLPAVEAPDGDGVGQTGTLILSVGRLEKYKGHQRMIRACREVMALLEVSISLLTGEADRQQFAEANVRFSGQMALLYKLLVSPDQQAPLPVAKTRAELDEEMDAMRQHARQRLIDQYEATTRRQDARRAYWNGRVQS